MAIEKIQPETKVEASVPVKEKAPDLASAQKARFEIPWFKPEKKKSEGSPEKKSTAPVHPAAPISVPAWHSQRAIAIDAILSEGLNEIFLSLKPDEQRAFIKKGEETVVKINELLSKTKVRMSKIVALIKDWLKMIPGLNKYFLEQEAKIKADKILKLKNKL